MPLNSSHVSSSHINKTFSAPASKPSSPKISSSLNSTSMTPKPAASAAPSMSFSQMQSQNISGGTRTGAAPLQLPAQNSITAESITAMSQGQYKPGTLGAYQNQAISKMQDSGRDTNFMISNLNQATAMQMPNWNLPAGQASQAASMVGSGRSQDFIRSAIGASSSTPVPGKAAR